VANFSGVIAVSLFDSSLIYAGVDNAQVALVAPSPPLAAKIKLYKTDTFQDPSPVAVGIVINNGHSRNHWAFSPSQRISLLASLS
jgi:hypothetical protein